MKTLGQRIGDPRGFSATELVVAAALVGILFAIALPAFHQVRLGALLTGAQQDVASTLLRARWLAINSGQARTVDLAASQRVRITNGGGTTLASAELRAYEVVQTHSGDNTFSFDPRGLVEAGTATPITITLTNPGGATKVVSVDRLGRVYAAP